MPERDRTADRGPKDARRLELPIVPPWQWVSWVGAVSSALRARGVECDSCGVAGYSGYAFMVNVGPGLAPEAIAAFDWKLLEPGLAAFGVAAEVVMVDCEPGSEDRERFQAELFERVREEVDRGSACVVWGAGPAPEFAVAYGYTRDGYLVRSLRSVGGPRGLETGRAFGPAEHPEPPVRFDALAAPGRLGAVFFGEDLPADRPRAEHLAIVRAGQLLEGRHSCFEPGYMSGRQGFEYWAEQLAGAYEPMGNSYLLNCFHELQLHAGGFCRRLSQARSNAAAALGVAAAAFRDSADRLCALRERFRFPGEQPAGPAAVKAAQSSLRACAADNREASAALHDASALF